MNDQRKLESFPVLGQNAVGLAGSLRQRFSNAENMHEKKTDIK